MSRISAFDGALLDGALWGCNLFKAEASRVAHSKSILIALSGMVGLG